MIELRALSKIYKIAGQEIKAVQKVNLTVDDGNLCPSLDTQEAVRARF